MNFLNSGSLFLTWVSCHTSAVTEVFAVFCFPVLQILPSAKNVALQKPTVTHAACAASPSLLLSVHSTTFVVAVPIRCTVPRHTIGFSPLVVQALISFICQIVIRKKKMVKENSVVTTQILGWHKLAD